MSKEKTIASIDLGNSKIRVIIGDVVDGKVNQIIGVGIAPAVGMRKGAIIDVEETIAAVVTALEDAERMSGETINHAVIGISGPHIEAFESSGVIAISGQEINEDDIERALETARAINLPPNKVIIKVIPRSFTIDTQAGIRYPLGMSGRKLEVSALIVVGDMPILKNIEKTIFETGVDIDDLMPNLVALPEAVVTKRQKELGVAVVDIGASSTALTVFEDGVVLTTQVLPIAAENATNDLAIGMRCAIDTAEKVKIEFGSVDPETVANTKIDLAQLTRGEEGEYEHKYVAEILQARYHELFMMVKNALSRIGKDGMLPAGLIITGGGAKIPGLSELAREVMGLSIQIGFPMVNNKVVDQVDDPSFVSVIGLFITAARGDYKHSLTSYFDVSQLMTSIKTMFQRLLP